MSRRRREARVELECVEIVHVHARGATTEPSRGRGDDGQPLSVGARARVGHGGAPDVRGEHRVGGERPVDSAVDVGVGGVGRLSLRAGFDSRALERRCRRRRLRKVLLEHLHHLPGFEVDDVDRAARADRDENLAVRGEEEEVRARDPSAGLSCLRRVHSSSSPPGVTSKRRRLCVSLTAMNLPAKEGSAKEGAGKRSARGSRRWTRGRGGTSVGGVCAGRRPQIDP